MVGKTETAPRILFVNSLWKNKNINGEMQDIEEINIASNGGLYHLR